MNVETMPHGTTAEAVTMIGTGIGSGVVGGGREMTVVCIVLISISGLGVVVFGDHLLSYRLLVYDVVIELAFRATWTNCMQWTGPSLWKLGLLPIACHQDRRPTLIAKKCLERDETTGILGSISYDRQ